MRSHAHTKMTPDALTLVLSNSTDATADYLCDRLAQADVSYRRLDTDLQLDTLLVTMSDDDLSLVWDAERLRPNHVRAVVYRRPKPFAPPIHGDIFRRNHASDEWAEAIEGFLAHVSAPRWINHPTSNFSASHKIHQLTRARDCGLATPEWMVTTVPAEARRFLDAHERDIVAKPLASGYIERDNPQDDTVIFTSAIEHIQPEWLDNLPACPVLFQRRVHKRVDVRVTALDQRAVAVALEAREPDGNQRIDVRRDCMRDVSYAIVPIPEDVLQGIARLMAGYRLRFAAIDFAIDEDGHWMFFEVNPNGQWAWLDLVGAADIGQLFIDALR